jgi:hypothetical protein
MLINPLLYIVSNFMFACDEVEETLQKISCFFSVIPILWIFFLGVVHSNAFIMAAILVPLIVDIICATFPKVPYKGHWFLLAVAETHIFFWCAVAMLLGGPPSNYEDFEG